MSQMATSVMEGVAPNKHQHLKMLSSPVERRREPEIEYLLNDEHLTSFTCSLLLQIAALVISQRDGRKQRTNDQLGQINRFLPHV
jgi:hypothetical protein